MLIGIDGRAGGREALALARVLTAACPTAELTLAHVCVESRTQPGGVPRRSPGPSSHPPAEALLVSERERAGIAANLCWTAAATPAAGFASLMTETGADLLVLGSSHRGAAARVLLGDSCRGALELGGTAVAVAPAGYGSGAGLETIGIGHDGSPAARYAFNVARRLSAGAGAALTCATVIPSQQIAYGQPIDGALDAALLTVFSEDERAVIRDEDITTFVGYGQPGSQLAAFSSQVDLLVLGAAEHVRQHLPFGGSAAAYLASHASCPLLVVAPAPAARSLSELSPVHDELQPQR